MESAAGYIVRHLREAGYRAVSRGMGDCHIISAQRGDRVYVASVARGSMADVYVVKVTIPEHLHDLEWSCELLEYSPYGFYILEKDLDKLVSGVMRKLELLDELYRTR